MGETAGHLIASMGGSSKASEHSTGRELEGRGRLINDDLCTYAFDKQPLLASSALESNLEMVSKAWISMFRILL